jgi:hypothetical protein
VLLPCNPLNGVRRESEIPRLGINIASAAIQLSAGVVKLAYLGNIAAQLGGDRGVVVFDIVHA